MSLYEGEELTRNNIFAFYIYLNESLRRWRGDVGAGKYMEPGCLECTRSTCLQSAVSCGAKNFREFIMSWAVLEFSSCNHSHTLSIFNILPVWVLPPIIENHYIRVTVHVFIFFFNKKLIIISNIIKII